jgi:hypothetical protein
MSKPKPLGPRLFTLQEAEAVLPAVRERLAAFQIDYARLDGVRRDLSVLRLVSASGGDRRNRDVSELRGKEREEAEILARLHAIQEDLLECGCVPKSIDEGLIDFFALKNGRLVFLCWKQGESRIEAWHTLEGGFAGRMPIRTFLAPEPSGEIG